MHIRAAEKKGAEDGSGLIFAHIATTGHDLFENGVGFVHTLGAVL